jgi:hypothetical protein
MNKHEECVENFINSSAFEFLFPQSLRGQYLITELLLSCLLS